MLIALFEMVKRHTHTHTVATVPIELYHIYTWKVCIWMYDISCILSMVKVRLNHLIFAVCYWYGHSMVWMCHAMAFHLKKNATNNKIKCLNVKIFHLSSHKIIDNWTRDTTTNDGDEIFARDCKMENYQLAISMSFFLICCVTKQMPVVWLV